MQEWRFFVKSEQSYKFFQFFKKSSVVKSISEKKNLKIFFTTHQNSLIHSVENNLTIMSRISDVVNKIMQISGEMNTLRSCQLS